MTSKQQRIEEIEQKIHQLKERKAAILARTKHEDRSRSTRQKILVGSFVIDATNGRPASITIGGRSLSDFLKRPQDRQLFGLRELSDQLLD